MNIFEIIGPVMVGPSSSHTAGACRIGYICSRLLGEKIEFAEIGLYGSFLSTGKGHGTQQALVAGLLGMKPDDSNIPCSFEIAKNVGLSFEIKAAKLRDAHPNSVSLFLRGTSGKELNIVAESIGGSIINIASVDGLNANFSGDYPTLIINNTDVPGMLSAVSDKLSENNINIANMQLYRASRGKNAVLIIESDQEIPREIIEAIKNTKGINKVSYLSLEEV